MRVGPVLAHLGIARVPSQFGLRVQPDNTLGAVIQLFQYLGMRFTVVVPRVAQNNDRGAVVDVVQAEFFEIQQCLTVVGGAAAVVVQGFRYGVFELVAIEQFGDLGKIGGKRKATHLGHDFVHAVQKHQHETRIVGDRAGNIADGENFRPIDFYRLPIQIKYCAVVGHVVAQGLGYVELAAFEDFSASAVQGAQLFRHFVHHLLNQAEVAVFDV